MRSSPSHTSHLTPALDRSGRAYREANRQELLSTPRHSPAPPPPPLSNGFSSSSGVGVSGNGGGLPSHYTYANNRTAEDLEGQNDEHLEGLSAKVKMLKNVRLSVEFEGRRS